MRGEDASDEEQSLDADSQAGAAVSGREERRRGADTSSDGVEEESAPHLADDRRRGTMPLATGTT